MQYTIVNTGDESNVIAFLPGKGLLVAHSDHPNYAKIVYELTAEDLDGHVRTLTDEQIAELFDVGATISSRFEDLSERVSVNNGKIYLDGDEINNTLTKHILRFLAEGVDDWKPLVHFFEKVQANPQSHSRQQLYSWLDKRNFTITPTGDIVAYKGVRKYDEGNYVSIHSGPAVVDGEPMSGNIPNAPGSVITMPRSDVAHNPSEGCSVGLHVGTHDYANWFAQGAVLEVHVNPRDVVSVPTDSGWAKVRVCRYVVIDVIGKEIQKPVRTSTPENTDPNFAFTPNAD